MDLVVEDGTGVTDANSYADIDTADDYYSAHLYAAAWLATEEEEDEGVAKKTAALIMAARMLDASCEWRGLRKSWAQGLEWPRVGAVLDIDPTAADYAIIPPDAENQSIDPLVTVPSNIVPKPIIRATIELCRFLLAKDRDTDADASTVKRKKVDTIEIEYVDGGGRPDIIPESVLRLVRPYTLTAPNASGAASASAFTMIRG